MQRQKRTAQNRRARQQIKRVVKWCKEHKLSVVFTPKESDGTLDFSTLEITVNSHFAPLTKLHVLLHECGHFIITINEVRSHLSAIKGGDKAIARGRSSIARIATLEDEYLAWATGVKLATDLNLNIDMKSLIITQAKMLKSYIKWVLE